MDTTPDAAALQAEIQRRLSPVQRLAIAFEMSDLVRSLALAGLRSLHPDWSEVDLRRELLRRQFPSDQLPLPLR